MKNNENPSANKNTQITHSVCVNTITENLEKNLTSIKKILPAEDILTYSFETADNTACAIVYADGMVNKQLLGDLIARPLSKLDLRPENQQKTKNEGGRVASNSKKSDKNNSLSLQYLIEKIEKTALFPELKQKTKLQDIVKEILDGNSLLLVDGAPVGFIVGAKFIPVRAVIEPPTDVAIKGPREGFIEDIKTNMALLRKRLKTPDLRFDSVKIGKRSDTLVSVCYLSGTCDETVKEEVKKKLQDIQIDCIPDSSYIATLLAPRKHSIFQNFGTTEKPDILAAKLSEGRIGILVDGSPIVLTAPFLLTENLQSSEDYFVSPFMATIFRLLRFISVLIAVFLPAFYVSAQLFKMQLLPLGLTLTIASSVRELPLSPSLEMFLVLLLLEVLKEASIRMPKYVGMSLSVVGALVLGETAVSAGFLSTPAIIIVAFSGICLYTIPNFVETGSILRWLFLLIAGSVGPFGIVLLAAFFLYYMITSDAFGAPILAPFSPLVTHDLRDTVIKSGIRELSQRPQLMRSKNKTRLRLSYDGEKTSDPKQDQTPEN
ncbi:MAG: spore germination protein [Clostridia bacterium]|nr:spore germination protein [Clostridia bacterium]